MQFNDPEYVLRWFKNDHLPNDLRLVVEPFQTLAQWLYDRTALTPELGNALQWLLLAKDSAVRASLPLAIANDA